MNKTEILDTKSLFLSIFLDIHNNRQNHRLAMRSAVEEFGQVILYATLELDAVYSLATLQNTHN